LQIWQGDIIWYSVVETAGRQGEAPAVLHEAQDRSLKLDACRLSEHSDAFESHHVSCRIAGGRFFGGV
jgi:hypothetical protein